MTNQYILPSLSDNARVWVYQSNRIFSEIEAKQIEKFAKEFVATWKAHGAKLLADATVFENVFLIIAVDEIQQQASGCSIDASVKIVNEVQKVFKTDFFDRMVQTFKPENGLVQAKLSELDKYFENGTLTENTLVFDPLLNNLGKLRSEFLKPIKNSWHSRFMPELQ